MAMPRWETFLPAAGSTLSFNPKISEYNFMAGPSYRLRMKEKYSISAFAEGGVGLGKFCRGLEGSERGGYRRLDRGLRCIFRGWRELRLQLLPESFSSA